MDLYLIGRLLSTDSDNIIVFAGGEHIRRYRDFLWEEKGYEISYAKSSMGCLDGVNVELTF